MGGGDVKLAAAIGAALGWQWALVSFFLSFLIGAVVALILVGFAGRKMADRIPFGPFLAIGGLAAFFVGPTLADLYMRLLW